MNQSQLKTRYDELKNLINQYSYEYHVKDRPTVDDSVYDSLFLELKQIEANSPNLITSDSPTQRVGNKLSSRFNKVAHTKRMLSLNDVFDKSEIEAWVSRMDKILPGKRHEFFTDIKMDGLACSLIYVDGKLTQAVTRGDSFIGEDVTLNVRTIKNVPLSLRRSEGYEFLLNGRTEIRGEIIMLKKDFERINAQQEKAGLTTYANPRNLAAGTIRQLDPKLVASRPLSFRGYDLIRDEPAQIPTNMYAYQALTEIGITRNMQAAVFDNLSDVMKFISTWDQARHDLDFNTDGLVVKVNNRKYFDDLGIVGKQPRGAVAYKYAAEQATSVIKDIVISIGRTGAATPVAVFDPVAVAGTTVKHASLHNSDEIDRLDLRIGDTAVIYKAGDIIPQVKNVITELRPQNSQKFDFEVELKRQYPELKFERLIGEAVYRIKGASGSLILKKSLEHYASKAALNIDTLGEKNVSALVDAGLVADIADIYKLKVEDLLKLDRFAIISARKLIMAIENSKNPPLAKFLYGLGIRHIGTQTAIDLVNEFEDINKIREASLERLQAVDGIGKVVAESVVAWFSLEDNLKLLDKFESLGVKPHHEKASGLLDGLSFVVTGSLETMSRDEAAEKIRQSGGVFQSSVGKDTKYLVAGEKVGASKLAKAEKYGTKIVTEQEFLNMF